MGYVIPGVVVILNFVALGIDISFKNPLFITVASPPAWLNVPIDVF